MRDERLLLVPILVAALAGAGQEAPQDKCQYKKWLDRHEEVVDLLRTAAVVSVEEIGKGVTRPRRATLQKGDQTSRAAFKPIKRGRQMGYWESYEAEVAAYEMDRLLGLDMVPPTVVRTIKGDSGSLQFWVEGCNLYADVQQSTPQTPSWSHELSRMKIFDVLVNNEDRNAGNFLVDPHFHIVLIDHSRAFVTGTRILKNPGKLPAQFDRKLVERMRGLTRETLEARLGKLLMDSQIKAILERRDGILQHLEKLIKEKGESRVFF